MRAVTRTRPVRNRCRRAGASTLDYILVLGIILPLVAMLLPTPWGDGPVIGIIRSVYEMITVLIAWPFM